MPSPALPMASPPGVTPKKLSSIVVSLAEASIPAAPRALPITLLRMTFMAELEPCRIPAPPLGMCTPARLTPRKLSIVRVWVPSALTAWPPLLPMTVPMMAVWGTAERTPLPPFGMWPPSRPIPTRQPVIVVLAALVQMPCSSLMPTTVSVIALLTAAESR